MIGACSCSIKYAWHMRFSNKHKISDYMDCNNNINIMMKWDMRAATTTPGFMGDKRVHIVYTGFKTPH